MADVAAPRAGTIKNLHVRCISGSNANSAVTVQVNGVDSTLTVTVTSGSGTANFSDTTHSVVLLKGDRVRLKVVNSGGTNLVLAGWSLEFD